MSILVIELRFCSWDVVGTGFELCGFILVFVLFIVVYIVFGLELEVWDSLFLEWEVY